MRPEILIILAGIFITSLCIFIDIINSKKGKNGFFFSVLNIKMIEENINHFPIRICLCFILFTSVVFIVCLRNELIGCQFSGKSFFFYIAIVTIFLFMAARFIVSFIIRKEDDGEALLLNTLILIIFLVLGAFIFVASNIFMKWSGLINK